MLTGAYRGFWVRMGEDCGRALENVAADAHKRVGPRELAKLWR